MQTDFDTPQTGDAAPATAEAAVEPHVRPDHASPPTDAPQPDDEVEFRVRENLPPDAMILVPSRSATTPMRLPDNTWGMLVVAAGTTVETGSLVLFAGCPIPAQPDPVRDDGDVVVRLHPPTDGQDPDWRASHVDAELLVARDGVWRPVQRMNSIGPEWPQVLGRAAATVMRTQTEDSEIHDSDIQVTAAPTPTGDVEGVPRASLAGLLSAGLLQVGDELVFHQRNVRQVAWVLVGGALQVPDGRVFKHPSGALTAWGFRHWNGWTMLRRASDSRTLAELRDLLHTRQTGSHPSTNSMAGSP